MEKEQIKIYLERMHKHYSEFVNEYTNKADAILNVIEFINEAELKGY